MDVEALHEKLVGLDDGQSKDLFARGFLRLERDEDCRFVPAHYVRAHTPVGVFHHDARLPLVVARSGLCRLVLLGVAVDAETGESSLQGIADRLAERLRESREAFFEYVDWLGGRFVVFYRRGALGRVRAFSDATGMRALFQHREKAGIAGSHAALLAVNAGDAGESVDRKLPVKFGYPGLTTPYRAIDFVAPNTELELTSGRVFRFYPRTPIESHSTATAARKLVPLMQNLARGYHDIAPVIFSLTAGVDARLALAMQRPLLDNAAAFTYYRKPEVDTDGADLYVAGELAEDLGLRWQVLRVRGYKADRRLDEIVKLNAQYAHLPRAAQFYRELWADDETLHIRSNISEIGRVFYWRRRNQRNSTNPDDWMRPFFNVLNRHQTPSEDDVERARAAFQEQFSRTDMASAVENIHYLDLMYWEHRMASWHSQVVAESDIAFESVSLYNCRKVPELLLSQPFRARRDATLYHECIRKAWPRLLDWPINPKRLTSEQITQAEARIGPTTNVSSA
jgi:hypothetical protein